MEIYTGSEVARGSKKENQLKKSIQGGNEKGDARVYGASGGKKEWRSEWKSRTFSGHGKSWHLFLTDKDPMSKKKEKKMRNRERGEQDRMEIELRMLV